MSAKEAVSLQGIDSRGGAASLTYFFTCLSSRLEGESEPSCAERTEAMALTSVQAADITMHLWICMDGLRQRRLDAPTWILDILNNTTNYSLKSLD